MSSIIKRIGFPLLLLTVGVAQAATVGGVGSSRPPMQPGQQADPEQTQQAGKTQDRAGGQVDALNAKLRRSQKARAGVISTLAPAERRQLDAVSRLAHEATTSQRARRRLDETWGSLVRELVGKDPSVNVNALVEAAMAQAYEQQARELRQALENQKLAYAEQQKVQTELARAQAHQRQMARLPASRQAYRPATISGIKARATITSRKDMDKLVSDLSGRHQSASDNMQQAMMALQQKQEQSTRAMQMISNVMKSMHDTARSAIQNMR